MSFELVCIWFPSGEGLGVCDKRLRSSPPYEGGQGDVDSEGVASTLNISMVHSQWNIPLPPSQGGFVDALRDAKAGDNE